MNAVRHLRTIRTSTAKDIKKHELDLFFCNAFKYIYVAAPPPPLPQNNEYIFFRNY